MNKTTFGTNDYEILDREILYQGMFRLVLLKIKHRTFRGGWSEIFSRELLERLPAAAVLPFDPHEDRVILIEQFRPGAVGDHNNPWQIEIPAGILDSEETPAQIAVREANEEAGCTVSELKLIQDYFVSPGGTNEYIHVYCGKVDSCNIEGIHGLVHEHEDIRVMNIPTEEAFAKMDNREIKNAPAIIALQWLRLQRDRKQIF